LFRPKYLEGIFESKKVTKIADFISLRNAIMLIAALRKERVYREVYLCQEGQKSLEHCYLYLMSSHINKFKHRFIVPPEKHEFHTAMNFV
jgi:hypothetical protein